MRPIACRGARLAQCNSSARAIPRRLLSSTSARRDSSNPRPPHNGQATNIHGSKDGLDQSRGSSRASLASIGESQDASGPRASTSHSTLSPTLAASADADEGASKPRRTLRQRRLAEADIPKPPPLPLWFLRHNVRFCPHSEPAPDAEAVEHQSSSTAGHTLVKCVDKETGHTLFTVPSHGHTLFAIANASSPAFPEEISEASSTRLHICSPHYPLSLWVDSVLWFMLEAELCLQAAFELATRPQQSASFAASRTDLVLTCPDDRSHHMLDLFVEDLATTTAADVVSLDVNDLEDLTAEYVGGNKDTPSSFATLGYHVYDGYVATKEGLERRARATENETETREEEEEEDDPDDVDTAPKNLAAGFADTLKRHGFLVHHFDPRANMSPPVRRRDRGNKSSTTSSATSTADSDYVLWDEARLDALLNRVLDAPRSKRAVMASSPSEFTPAPRERRPHSRHEGPLLRLARLSAAYPRPASFAKESEEQHTPASALPLYRDLVSGGLFDFGGELGRYFPSESVSVVAEKGDMSTPELIENTRTIVHLRDVKDLRQTPLGDKIVQRLVHLVHKRRRNGEQIAMVGTSAHSGLGSWALEETEDLHFRTMLVPPFYTFSNRDLPGVDAMPRWLETSADVPARRILEINLRHIQSMLRRLQANFDADLLTVHHRAQLAHGGTRLLTEKVLSLDEVQRLALLAFALTKTYATSDVIQPIHLGLACFVTSRTDSVMQAWAQKDDSTTRTVKNEAPSAQSSPTPEQIKIESIRKSCNPHETRLLSGVVDASSIKTGFDDVHAAPDTIEALKTLTELALLRPSAFKYGVLAKDRLPGLLLYGLPGTGKSLLAKALAQGSKSTVLEVTGAQIAEKYVGESEKMVRAVFSLARKLSPCVVFIDEADSILGSRNEAHARVSHRATINQFLREWDGMDDHGVFIMVATNRPFDLDDAVLRRLPRRLLVDLPVAADREKILEIHLRGEELDSSVSLCRLAEETPLYSGSDLKNMCVAAALACVREENALQATKRQTEPDWTLPDRRVLSRRHFDQALVEISASVSEDMATLAAIRKFDERYGDRKGRRPKTRYGFGGGDAGVNEEAARVRQVDVIRPGNAAP